ncbi:MAG: sterol desaturase family protein [Nevskiaceae bacterium]|nr:MAG: sterol desaturase family protein [Nevskiaceae bacterium]TBR71528.1 MAG: sterol desaturase family protein [Nevskiaceae bacterium]
MNAFLLAHEPAIRLGFFLGSFTLMAAWEVLAPRRPVTFARRRRWPANLGIIVIDSVVARLLFPVAAVGMAAYATAHGWGLLSVLTLPGWATFVVAFVLLDLAIYLQHVMFHAVPLLWRLHRMHHTDLAFDVTTGTRFHPLEIVLSLGLKFAVIAALGAPPAAVLMFEVVLNATSMFNHGNVRLPAAADRVLRLLLVTPDMHRVHHSVRREETDSNFGFNLACWDRLFGTYRAQPRDGHDGMTIGLSTFRDPHELRLYSMLLQPFRAEPRKAGAKPGLGNNS